MLSQHTSAKWLCYYWKKYNDQSTFSLTLNIYILAIIIIPSSSRRPPLKLVEVEILVKTSSREVQPKRVSSICAASNVSISPFRFRKVRQLLKLQGLVTILRVSGCLALWHCLLSFLDLYHLTLCVALQLLWHSVSLTIEKKISAISPGSSAAAFWRTGCPPISANLEKHISHILPTGNRNPDLLI